MQITCYSFEISNKTTPIDTMAVFEHLSNLSRASYSTEGDAYSIHIVCNNCLLSFQYGWTALMWAPCYGYIYMCEGVTGKWCKGQHARCEIQDLITPSHINISI